MAGITQSDLTRIGTNGVICAYIGTSSTTKAATIAADATRVGATGYLKQGDLIWLECTDGYAIGVVQSNGSIADANA